MNFSGCISGWGAEMKPEKFLGSAAVSLPLCHGSILLALLVLAPTAQARWDDAYVRPDIRLRGYRTDHRDVALRACVPPAADPDVPERRDPRDEEIFGAARVRLALHADWTDQVSTRITGHADSLWGRTGCDDRLAAGLSEAWLELHNLAFSPLSLKAGRQHLHYGGGLVISGRNEDWDFDAARLVYDALPTSADLVYGSVTHLSPDSEVDHFWRAGIRREFEGGPLRDLEAYAGTFSLAEDGRPVLLGARAAARGSPCWRSAAEAAYECGEGPGGRDLSAFLADFAVERRFPQAAAAPAIRLGWTHASGDRTEDGQRTFVGLLNHEEWGRVFSPRLSNIHIFSLRGSLTPAPGILLAIELYSYGQARAFAAVAADGRLENGGYLVTTAGEERHLGDEADLVVEYTWRERLTFRTYAGHFVPGEAYDGQPGDEIASELGVELRARF